MKRFEMSGIFGIKKLGKKYKEADLYFHIDLDGVTSAIATKEYLKNYGIDVVRAIPIQYGGLEYAADKPENGRLAVLVDFANGKPSMDIHIDHHDRQCGVCEHTATNFVTAPSNAGTISDKISSSNIFPQADVSLIDIVDSASFFDNEISVDQVLKCSFKFDPDKSTFNNHTSIGLVANQILLAFKNKLDYLSEIVLTSKPSLISIYSNLKKLAIDKGYPIDQLQDKKDKYVESQSSAKKMIVTDDIDEIANLSNGQYVIFDNIMIQYGGGNTFSGYDRYAPFKNHPEVDFLILGWQLGLVQVSKNPFKKVKHSINLGDVTQPVIDRHKDSLFENFATFDQIKRLSEIEIYKKQVIDKLHILIGAMILDGYDEYDSCVKYVNELIKELENE
jgi:hypothetical protein